MKEMSSNGSSFDREKQDIPICRKSQTEVEPRKHNIERNADSLNRTSRENTHKQWFPQERMRISLTMFPFVFIRWPLGQSH